MDALTPAQRLFVPDPRAMNTGLLPVQVSLFHVSGLPSIPPPITLARSYSRFNTQPLSGIGIQRRGNAVGSGLRHRSAGSPLGPAETGSSSCGLLVHLPLLSTSPRGDAVTFSYRPECACLKRTCISPTKHAYRRTEPAGLRRTARLGCSLDRCLPMS